MRSGLPSSRTPFCSTPQTWGFPLTSRTQESKICLPLPPRTQGRRECFGVWAIFEGKKLEADDLITNPWTNLFSAATTKSYKPVTRVKRLLFKCESWRGERKAERGKKKKALTSYYGFRPDCKEGICEIQGPWVLLFLFAIISETRPGRNQFRFRKNITLIFYIKLPGSLS